MPTRISALMISLVRPATRLFALVFALMAAVPAAVAQETERPQFNLLDRLFGGSERFGTPERAAPTGEQASPAGQERPAQSGSDLMLRLDRLEAQIRQLTGVIEQLQFRNQQLEQHVRRMQDDAEQRFQELGSKGASGAKPSANRADAGRSGRRHGAGTARRRVRPGAASERAGRAADAGRAGAGAARSGCWASEDRRSVRRAVAPPARRSIFPP